eukprot:scaffold3302_cov335-Prasinococcus_capsulatus_cf.AAC.4
MRRQLRHVIVEHELAVARARAGWQVAPQSHRPHARGRSSGCAGASSSAAASAERARLMYAPLVSALAQAFPLTQGSPSQPRARAPPAQRPQSSSVVFENGAQQNSARLPLPLHATCAPCTRRRLSRARRGGGASPAPPVRILTPTHPAPLPTREPRFPQICEDSLPPTPSGRHTPYRRATDRHTAPPGRGRGGRGSAPDLPLTRPARPPDQLRSVPKLTARRPRGRRADAAAKARAARN